MTHIATWIFCVFWMIGAIESNISSAYGTERVQSSSEENECFRQNTTINLMWINRKKSEDAVPEKIVHPRGILQKDEIIDPFQRLEDWHKTTLCPVVFWYDSQLIEDQGIQNLQEKMAEAVKKNQDITARDIRELSFVQENPHFFTERSSVYFRVDLARVLLSIECLQEGISNFQIAQPFKTPAPQAIVYGDFSVRPLSWEQLMDPPTTQSLKDKGLVLGKGPNSFVSSLPFENGFHILSNCCPLMLETLKISIVDQAIFLHSQKLENKFLLWGFYFGITEASDALKAIRNKSPQDQAAEKQKIAEHIFKKHILPQDLSLEGLKGIYLKNVGLGQSHQNFGEHNHCSWWENSFQIFMGFFCDAAAPSYENSLPKLNNLPKLYEKDS